MTLHELIARRQSCRRYADRPVPRGLIDQCLDAARLAPSACNSQPWRFVVADRDPGRGLLAASAFAGRYSMNQFAVTAPVLVAVVDAGSGAAARVGGWLRDVRYSLVDIGIAGTLLDLQAAELGLGVCWLGWFDERAVRKALRLPRAARVPLLFSLGYPAEETIRPKTRKALDEIRVYADARA